ncbi:MAG: aminopeptidase, partial [Rhizobiaceae bacterium]|nr:aminopeptidase [Rhizobiaceae bacterium]
PDENLIANMHKVGGQEKRDNEGRYYSAELDAELVCEDAGGEMYVAFEGFLGKGAMQPIYAIGPDVWIMPNERAMDSAAPGDWTVVFSRGSDGEVARVTMGCWLARKVIFEKR